MIPDRFTVTAKHWRFVLANSVQLNSHSTGTGTWLKLEQLVELLRDFKRDLPKWGEAGWIEKFSGIVSRIRKDLFEASPDSAETAEIAVEIYKAAVQVPLYWKAIPDNREKMNEAIRFLGSDADITDKVSSVIDNDGRYFISGLGAAFWSLFFMAYDPKKYFLWNRKTENALVSLGLIPPGLSGAEAYVAMSNAMVFLSQLGAEFSVCELDAFMHYVSIPGEPGAEKVLKYRVERRIAELKNRVLKAFPGLNDVDHPAFKKDEIDYKREASEHIRTALSKNEFARHIESGNYPEVIRLLKSSASKTNLLYLGTPSTGDLAILHSDFSDLERLCQAFYELLWGEEDSPVRLEKFYGFISEAGFPSRWPIATYYLFLAHPESEMFVKPGITKWLLDFFEMPLRYRNKPTAELYSEILRLCRVIKSTLKDWKTSDMIDVQSLVWVACKASEPEVEKVVEKEPEMVKVLKPDPGSLFSEETFQLLQQLHENPTKKYYSENAEAFNIHLREPMKRLFEVIASEMPSEFQKHMETENRLFSRIPKNDWGKGGAWDYFWGAFYPKGENRVTSEQLYVLADRHGIRYGLSRGVQSSKTYSAVKDLLKNNPAIEKQVRQMLQSVKGLMYNTPDASAQGTPLPAASQQFSEWMESPVTTVDQASAFIGREEVISMSLDELKERVSEAFLALFPLVIGDEEILISLIKSEDEDEPELNPILTIEQIHEQTGYDLIWIRRAISALKNKRQAVLYGPPGTGKTFLSEKIAAHLTGGGKGFTELVQFHPSYTYEDFMEGLRPKAIPGIGLEYKIVEGRFKNFCAEAGKLSDPCVLIIDEINRANLSRVFGELMYLLEYRDKSIPLASGSSFSIPRNVHVIGTMNTADRSIALVDHALRRRFAFIHMMPDYSVLKHYHKGGTFNPDGLVKVLERINKAIEDRNFFIGVSFFLHEDIENRLESIWQLEIEPYLDELFFDRPDTMNEFLWNNVRTAVLGEE